jgi:hypothetical protein
MNNITVEQFMLAKGFKEREILFDNADMVNLLEEFHAVLKLRNFSFIEGLKPNTFHLIDVDKNIVIGIYQTKLPLVMPAKESKRQLANNEIMDEAESLFQLEGKPDKIQITPETTLFELRDVLPTKCFNAVMDAFKMMGSTPLYLIAKLNIENLKDISRLGAKGIAALSDVIKRAGLKFAPAKLTFQQYKEILNTKP